MFVPLFSLLFGITNEEISHAHRWVRKSPKKGECVKIYAQMRKDLPIYLSLFLESNLPLSPRNNLPLSKRPLSLSRNDLSLETISLSLFLSRIDFSLCPWRNDLSLSHTHTHTHSSAGLPYSSTLSPISNRDNTQGKQTSSITGLRRQKTDALQDEVTCIQTTSQRGVGTAPVPHIITMCNHNHSKHPNASCLSLLLWRVRVFGQSEFHPCREVTHRSLPLHYRLIRPESKEQVLVAVHSAHSTIDVHLASQQTDHIQRALEMQREENTPLDISSQNHSLFAGSAEFAVFRA